MRPYIYILTFGLILFSCSQKRIESLDGSWRLDYNGQIESPFFPFELYFEGDSLILIDGNNFKHQIRYQIIDDSIEMFFSNESIRKLEFSFHSDSIISISTSKFYKFPNDFRNNVKPYELIDYKTDEILIDSSYSIIIHLVKIDGEVKVILNDIMTDLEKIQDFLETSSGTSPPLVIYTGKGLGLNDLVEAYMWIGRSNTHKVTLVTGNECFDKFYIVNDFISVNNSLLEDLLKKKKLKPLPTLPVDFDNLEAQVIEIRNQTDFQKLFNTNDSTNYFVRVDIQLDLLEYLEVLEILKGKENIKKEITAYNTGS